MVSTSSTVSGGCIRSHVDHVELPSLIWVRVCVMQWNRMEIQLERKLDYDLRLGGCSSMRLSRST